MTTRVQFDFPVMAKRDFRTASRGVRDGGVIAQCRAAAERWRQRRALEQLDDRTLRDIGISRSQALAEAAKPFWRE